MRWPVPAVRFPLTLAPGTRAAVAAVSELLAGPKDLQTTVKRRPPLRNSRRSADEFVSRAPVEPSGGPCSGFSAGITISRSNKLAPHPLERVPALRFFRARSSSAGPSTRPPARVVFSLPVLVVSLVGSSLLDGESARDRVRSGTRNVFAGAPACRDLAVFISPRRTRARSMPRPSVRAAMPIYLSLPRERAVRAASRETCTLFSIRIFLCAACERQVSESRRLI